MKNCRLLTVATFFAGAIVFGSPSSERLPGENAGISIHQTGVLVYPPLMLWNAIYYGEARVAISVDEKGNLTDSLVTGYTNVAFAETAVAAIKRWNYEAAREAGKARAATADVLFVFRDQGVIVHSLPGALERHRTFGAMQDRYAFLPCKLRELDRIPDPIHVVAPVGPKSSLSHVVIVEFYIDELGQVRMPAVARESADDQHAAAAIAAVEQWRFEPPLKKERPVLVHAQQEFHFQP